MSETRPINRREFVLQSSVVAGAGTTGLMGILREAVERAQLQDKPLLTETTFNAYATDVRRQSATASRAFVVAAGADLTKAIRDRFVLTSVQDRQLTSMTSAERSAVVAAIQRGFTGANEFRIKLPTTMTTANKGWTVSRSQKTIDGATAEIWVVTATEKVP